MARALSAGLLYFLLVFAAGSVLGTARVLVVAPLVGSPGAVLIELPVMLAWSWLACGFVIGRTSLEQRPSLRLTMGLSAFALLIAAELGLSVLLLGRTASEHLAHYAREDAMLGLVGQLGFAAFPLLHKS